MAMLTPELDLEESLVKKLRDLKYEYRPDIHDRATLEANFREKFDALNRVTLTDGEFQRLLDEIVTPDVYEAARSLRNREAFVRDDSTPLNYTLVNIKDWCKNSFEVVNQLRINTDNSHHRYDAILLINGVPVVQIELKTLGISPRRAMEQVVDYKNTPVTDTPRRFSASSSSSSSATARTRGTSPTTTRGTSSTRTSGSF
jgi:type I restriction enzyme R subunit